jgi:hypothetical protein
MLLPLVTVRMHLMHVVYTHLSWSLSFLPASLS